MWFLLLRGWKILKSCRFVLWNPKNTKKQVPSPKNWYEGPKSLSEDLMPTSIPYISKRCTGFWKVIFRPKRGSGGGSELSVGAQTLRTCATHQLGRLWKSERKILTLGEEISIFRFGQHFVFGSSRKVWSWVKIGKPKFLHLEWIFFAQTFTTCPAGV